MNADLGFAAVEAEEARYTLRAPQDIAAYLQAVARESLLVSVFYDAGRDFVLTTVLGVAVARGELYLEPPRESERRERLLAATALLACASKQGVVLKFALAKLWPARWLGTTALAAALPAALVRLQRREDFRVACPLVRPLQCKVTLDGATHRSAFDCPVLDLSCGGLALEVPPELTLVPGMRLHDCKLAFPESVQVSFELEVRSLAPVGNTRRLRAGCRFARIAPAETAKVRRYILALERARASRFGRV